MKKKAKQKNLLNNFFSSLKIKSAATYKVVALFCGALGCPQATALLKRQALRWAVHFMRSVLSVLASLHSY
jgi:hypothetical protein